MQETAYEVRTVAEGFHFLEGPRWRDGKLYFSDFYGRKVYALESGDKVSALFELPDWVSGLGFTPDGDLLVVAVSEHKVYRHCKDGKLVEFADLSGLASYNCNDMLVDEVGRAYIGNFGFDVPPTRTVGELKPSERVAPTNIFMVSPDGKASVAGSGLIFPNGMARSPDGRTLIVAETFRGRMTAFDIGDDGSLSGQRAWADFAGRDFASVAEAMDSGVPLPDGIAVDVEGAVWVADAGATAIIRVAPGGEILERIVTPGLTSFAVAFGGDDLKTLYMCAGPPFYTHDPNAEKASVLLATRVDVPGVPI
jgi:sugar lactone lactonase YvrE